MFTTRTKNLNSEPILWYEKAHDSPFRNNGESETNKETDKQWANGIVRRESDVTHVCMLTIPTPLKKPLRIRSTYYLFFG